MYVNRNLISQMWLRRPAFARLSTHYKKTLWGWLHHNLKSYTPVDLCFTGVFKFLVDGIADGFCNVFVEYSTETLLKQFNTSSYFTLFPYIADIQIVVTCQYYTTYRIMLITWL